MNSNPFFSKLTESKNIFLIGCGGGYDFLSSLPIYDHLKKTQKKTNIIFGNFSFSVIGFGKNIEQVCENVYRVTKDSYIPYKKDDYGEGKGPDFPEKYFCEFYEKKYKEEQSVYCFYKQRKKMHITNDINVKEYEKGINEMIEKYKIDTVVLIDGGNDSLMRGDEETYGTVIEDMTSIAGVYKALKVKKKFLISIGFGIDHHHGVEGAHVLENIANIAKNTNQGYLGCFSILKSMKEYQVMKEAYIYISDKMEKKSIVLSSIVSATDGHFGDYHSCSRTKGSKLFINPLMSIYWCFDLCLLAEQIYFIKEIIKKDSTEFDVKIAFEKYREELKKSEKIRVKRKIPH